jgi:hypothetical protein
MVIKFLSIVILFLTTCSQEAQFYGKGQDDLQRDSSPPVQVDRPSMACETKTEDQSCDAKDYQRLLKNYLTLKRKYLLLYRRISHHMKKYHKNNCEVKHGNKPPLCEYVE